MKKAVQVVPAPKVGLRLTILINAIAALVVQITFVIALFPGLKIVWGLNDISEAGLYQIMVTIIIAACTITAVAIVITEQLMERTLLKRDPSPVHLEINRAMYFAAIGILAVGAVKAFVEDRGWIAPMMALLCGILFYFGRYHHKFREARQGVWFPHAIFHWVLQQFVLCPLGLFAIRFVLQKVG